MADLRDVQAGAELHSSGYELTAVPEMREVITDIRYPEPSPETVSLPHSPDGDIDGGRAGRLYSQDMEV